MLNYRNIFIPPIENYRNWILHPTLHDVLSDAVFPFLLLIIAYILIKFPEKKLRFYTRVVGASLVIAYGGINIYDFIKYKNWTLLSRFPELGVWIILAFVILLIGVKSLYKSIKNLFWLYSFQKEKIIGIFGTSGAGKTTYIAMLAEMIWSSKAKSNWSLEIPHGMNYIKDVIKTLKKGEWPARTLPGTKEEIELMITEKNSWRNRIHKIFMSDISGEEFERFIKNPYNENLPPALEMINNCQGYIILVDPARAEDESYDYHAFLQYLVKSKGLKEKEKFQEFFAFVFTKNDEHNILNPEEFAREKMKALYHPFTLRIRKDRGRFFTCSSVGRINPRTKKPIVPPEPVGIEEPIEWMIENLKKTTIPPEEKEKKKIKKEEKPKEEIKKEEETEEKETKKIKICKNCGAIVDMDEDVCPECGGIEFEEVE
ncbi:hypothetical protein DRN73_10235 [Candidatus Pacearchaeota archaeon]|nr:MAG: hypothetical protein DRN73_10235 [Candidatus Pacearchaeota archaeon]